MITDDTQGAPMTYDPSQYANPYGQPQPPNWPPQQQPLPPAQYQPPEFQPRSAGKPPNRPSAKWIILAALALAVVGVVVNFQPVSILSGPGTLYIGAVIALVALAVGLVGRSRWWVHAVTGLVLALCIVNTVITQHNLNKRESDLRASLNTPISDSTVPVAIAPASLPPVAPAAQWSTTVAAQKYLAMIAPTNKAGDAFNNISGSTPLATVRADCVTFAADETTAIGQMRGGLWPTPVKEPIAALIPVVQAQETAAHNCSTAGSTSDAIAALNSSPDTTATGNAVRSALGLPPG